MLTKSATGGTVGFYFPKFLFWGIILMPTAPVISAYLASGLQYHIEHKWEQPCMSMYVNHLQSHLLAPMFKHHQNNFQSPKIMITYHILPSSILLMIMYFLHLLCIQNPLHRKQIQIDVQTTLTCQGQVSLANVYN